MNAVPTHFQTARRSLSLLALLGAACLLFTAAPRANATVAWHHGFMEPYGGGIAGIEETWQDAVTAEMGSDTMRITLSWDAYQTGVGEYNQQALDNIVSRVQAARGWSPNPFNPKALITFELPNEPIAWMQSAGYEMTAGEGTHTARYYPASIEGEKAYGKAMAKAFKYLYSVNIALAIETPNEPNLKNGPAWSIPAEYTGRLGAFGLVYAAAEGLPVLSAGGPAVLIGSVSTNPDTEHSSEGKTPAQYFRLVQTSADYWINWFYLGAPNGQSTAELLMGAWKASFHSYPELGGGESKSCEKTLRGGQYKTQDESGNLTGATADLTVRQRLTPVLEVLEEVPWKKKWWITETGMTSYKTNVSETEVECNARRVQGGSAYGKAEQKNFYADLAYNLDWQYIYGTYPWSAFEGVIFFKPLDGYADPTDAYKGFGAFTPGCGNYCWKPAAEYFANNL